MKKLVYGLILLTSVGFTTSKTAHTTSFVLPTAETTRWILNQENGITWNVALDKRLPHQDHLEMSGRKVSGIIRYGVDAQGNLILRREIIWPMLRTIPKAGEPDWAKYRAYLQRNYTTDITPEVKLNGNTYTAGKVSQIHFNGLLQIVHAPVNGLALTRTLFPSTTQTAFLEKWELKNIGKTPIKLTLAAFNKEEKETGIYGEYSISTSVKAVPETTVAAGKSLVFPIVFSARKAADVVNVNLVAEEQARRQMVQELQQLLVLNTPDPVLNRMFALAKIRAAESLFDTKMGLVHSPGGGRYYGGVWANDQVEYAGPFFPFLGFAPANEASLTFYRKFAADMKPDYSKIWASFEMEGDFPCCSKDRGDAAMYAYGASRFALARGDRKIAEELWPAIQWALEYNRRKKTIEGVIASETDEMEGRVPTGKANLSTSSLAYGGLVSAADLARSLGKTAEASKLEQEARELQQAIENHFGATIEGFKTYRYFDGHKTLRHWICLPLTMGILDRKEGTMQALFTRLWTPDGLAVEAGDKTFWDRGTLYGLRGAFNAGETQTAYEYLRAYSQRRLLGDHVPYAVEAYPEGGQAHLSAESALFARIITEGMLGIKPTGLNTFTLTPRLPKGWTFMELNKMQAFGTQSDIKVKQTGNKIGVTVFKNGKQIFTQQKPAGSTFAVKL